jgi:hypothetical protein
MNFPICTGRAHTLASLPFYAPTETLLFIDNARLYKEELRELETLGRLPDPPPLLFVKDLEDEIARRSEESFALREEIFSRTEIVPSAVAAAESALRPPLPLTPEATNDDCCIQ